MLVKHIISLLKQHNIAVNNPAPITQGASGAYVFTANNQVVVKYARLPDLEGTVRKQFRNEYEFYRSITDKEIDCIPEVIFSLANDSEILIIMKKYAPIENAKWDANLLRQAMKICARINSFSMTDTAVNCLIDMKPNASYSLSRSLENWERLRCKYPEHLDASLLSAMYINFNDIIALAETLDIPQVLCHGDFHPQNFLLNENHVVICDWQNVRMGRGISDVAFFISRGTDMGLIIDRNVLIAEYHKAVSEYTNSCIRLVDLYTNIAVSEFSVAFRFWAEYLQNSSIDRILAIYNAMVSNYRLLT